MARRSMNVLLVLVVGTLPCSGCVKTMRRTVTSPQFVETVDREAPFLKVHMRDGTLYVLSPWAIDNATRTVRGEGQRLDVNRSVLEEGTVEIPVDSAVLFETNVTRPSGATAALSVVTGISLGVTAFCLANTKACFGSCPTFYAEGDTSLIQAEGFSASIAPSLEADDLDHLYRVRASPPTLHLQMTNEAMETHVVRRADVILAPHPAGTRVFADADRQLWLTTEPAAPVSCRGPIGDCTVEVGAFDGVERVSRADSTDLATREIVDLTFGGVPRGDPAIVLASRQSLLPTYLLYQTLAYMGSQSGTWLATLERSDTTQIRHMKSVADILGGVEILVRDSSGAWIAVGDVRETGPLATDVRLVALPPGSDPSHVRLRMAAGAWRVDWVGLTGVAGPARGIRLHPSRMTSGGAPDTSALVALTDSSRTLVTFPGDAYTIEYDLPTHPGAAAEYDVFLDARGYYLEWMRSEWIAEENQARAIALFTNPRAALKTLAPEFKRAEPHLEAAFWRSRYAGH